VYHQGPVSFYMTKVDSAASADGSSDWFKIKEIGPDFSSGQAKWDLSGTYLAPQLLDSLLTHIQPHTLCPSPARFPPASTSSASSSSASTTLDPLPSSISLAHN
jgi:hypothetical protein